MLRKLIIILPVLFYYSNSNAQDFECSDCHDEVKISGTHLNVLECQDCHDNVIDEDHAEKGAEEVQCYDCHDDYANLVNRDIHHRLKDKVENPPNCQTCHGEHKIISPSSSRNHEKTYCSQCHDNIVMANPYHSIAVNDQTCFECHDAEDHTLVLAESVHKDLMCADCHNWVSQNIEKHQEDLPFAQTADCYLCHNNVAQEHRESIHGISIAEGIEESAQCWDCHGSHQIINVHKEESPVNSDNISFTCGKCHDDEKLVEKFDIPVVCPSKLYASSVHAKVIEEGKDGATCTSCHGAHTIKNLVQPGSSISPLEIPNTCGECHQEITEKYKKSMHWIRAQQGVRFAPVCNDCHCEHGVSAINSAEFPGDEIRRLQEETCIQCHQSPMVANRTGLEGGQANQYQDSYHGLAFMRGDTESAMCVDCHGVHEILPSKYPESMVSKENVTNTCRKCHEDATEIFSQSYSHQTLSEEARYVEGIVQNFYFWLIITVIGGMVLHNLIIFVYEIRRRRRKEKNVITLPRFTKNEVVQHILLLTSFIILAITGFALKYPDSFWAEGLLSLGLSETIRQNTHRVSAVIMIVLSFYHVGYLLFTRRGRDVLKEFIPSLQDLRDVVDNMKYYLRISKKHPHFGQYDYAEKAEYWALIWGTFVMGATGLVLWFPTVVGDWAPIWFIKVNEIIHFYEAILASLAILVWHWFFVIFHPKEYPMSFTWIDGKMSLESFRHHHERQFRKMLLEWDEYKNNSNDPSKLSHYTDLFITTLEKSGFSAEEILQNELNKDPELRAWFETNTGN
ncbi:MAG: cytochrome c3 family protein [Melioribacteraceae bacterium]|nr:cytochrome c3 family protein [Melioribacteraceae bacterium]